MTRGEDEVAAALPCLSDAERDPLTGVGNRARITGELRNRLKQLREGGEGFALVFLDVDGLKGINESFGRGIGDEVLRGLGERLQAITRASDAVGRLDGDEFVIIWRAVRSASEVRRLHKRVAEAFSDPIEAGGRLLRLTASAGALVVDNPLDLEPDDLLQEADAAMYRARSAGPGGLVFFEPDMLQLGERSLVTAAELRRAIREDELLLFAQPVMDVATGRTAGAEMLIRWQHPQRGLLGPADFLVAADAGGLMAEFGAWVIDRAVEHGATWEHNGSMDYFRVGINISPRQLTATDVVGQMREALARHGTSPDNFVIEIVESADFDSRSRATECVRQLIEMGLRVGIDDFGSGFSNMAHLRKLPVDLVKVDRALVGLDPDPRDEAILQAVQAISAAIGADVVLEGVENIKQLELAERCGVRFVQGFLTGRPAACTDARPEARDPRRAPGAA